MYGRYDYKPRPCIIKSENEREVVYPPQPSTNEAHFIPVYYYP